MDPAGYRRQPVEVGSALRSRHYGGLLRPGTDSGIPKFAMGDLWPVEDHNLLGHWKLVPKRSANPFSEGWVAPSENTRIHAAGLEVTRARKQLVSDFSLDLGREVVALLGPNGVGKTTLLEVLAGLTTPTLGVLQFVNESASGGEPYVYAARMRVGYVPQFDEPISGLSVRQSVAYAGWLKGMRGPSLNSATELALTRARCTDFANQASTKLSGGQFRRLLIAQALVHQPEILILDEPTASLDPHEQSELKLLLTEAKASTAIILTTHNLRDLPGLVDRVIVLSGTEPKVFNSVAAFCGLETGGPEPTDAMLQRAYSVAL